MIAIPIVFFVVLLLFFVFGILFIVFSIIAYVKYTKYQDKKVEENIKKTYGNNED